MPLDKMEAHQRPGQGEYSKQMQPGDSEKRTGWRKGKAGRWFMQGTSLSLMLALAKQRDLKFTFTGLKTV